MVKFPMETGERDGVRVCPGGASQLGSGKDTRKKCSN
jgi:hypothetical protein